MAKLTWLGEDELHGGGAGPSFTTAFGGIKFPKGEAVEVRSHALVQKALGNQYFEVDEADDVDDAPDAKRNKGGRPRKEEAKAEQQVGQLGNQGGGQNASNSLNNQADLS